MSRWSECPWELGDYVRVKHTDVEGLISWIDREARQVRVCPSDAWVKSRYSEAGKPIDWDLVESIT